MSPAGAGRGGVALVPDCLVNPAAPRYAELELDPVDLVTVLHTAGYGVLVLPSHLARDPEVGQGVTGVARDAADYARTGFRVVLIGLARVPDGAAWRAGVRHELDRWGVPHLPELLVDPFGLVSQEVQDFLDAVERADADADGRRLAAGPG